jgi:hypothetical protein
MIVPVTIEVEEVYGEQYLHFPWPDRNHTTRMPLAHVSPGYDLSLREWCRESIKHALAFHPQPKVAAVYTPPATDLVALRMACLQAAVVVNTATSGSGSCILRDTQKYFEYVAGEVDRAT